MLCEYGCGQESRFIVRKTHNCCSEQLTKCPAIRKKNSIAMMRAYATGAIKSNLKIAYAERKQELIEKIKQSLQTRYANSAFEDLPNRLQKELLLKESNGNCFGCDLSEWRDEKLTLQRHHKDGNCKNNKKENLEYLCPNCHSLTKTFGRKGRTNTAAHIKKSVEAKRLNRECQHGEIGKHTGLRGQRDI